MSTETNILLPTARVDIFVRDKETLEAARSLVNDWRFARVTLNVEEGDVETAIMAYEETSSPSLVIIETATTDESFTERLGALSSHCDEDTNAVVVGPVNDVTLYRNLTSMGVSDYLVKPVPLETLSEVIAGALVEKLGTAGSRLIGVIGAKGGVGTSSITQALSWGVSENLNQKTCLMDAAGGWSTMSVGLGFEPLATLDEAVRAAESSDEDTLARMFFNPSEKLSVLASGSDSLLETSVSAPQYEKLIDLMMSSYPVVNVDLSGAIPSVKKMVLSKAHKLVVVSTATLASLRATRTLLQEIKLLHGGDLSNVELVINMSGFIPSKEVPKKDIADALDHKPSMIIPFDPKLFVGCENEGKKISSQKMGSEIVESLLPIAENILGVKGKNSSKPSSENIVSDLLGKIGLGKIGGKG